MTIPENAVQWALGIANDSSHGYDQRNRKPVAQYPEYSVSSDGVVYSKSGKPLTMHETTKGYYRVKVYANGKKHWLVVHRAVASAFIPNPDNLACVNHKDENKHNNRAENLEWCTLEYNLGYGTKPQKTGAANQRNKGHRVVRLTDGMGVLYPSINHASLMTGIPRSAITKQCRSGGDWSYAV